MNVKECVEKLSHKKHVKIQHYTLSFKHSCDNVLVDTKLNQVPSYKVATRVMRESLSVQIVYVDFHFKRLSTLRVWSRPKLCWHVF